MFSPWFWCCCINWAELSDYQYHDKALRLDSSFKVACPIDTKPVCLFLHAPSRSLYYRPEQAGWTSVSRLNFCYELPLRLSQGHASAKRLEPIADELDMERTVTCSDH